MLNDIMTACFTRLATLSPPYPIAWPGTTFEPPATGAWLQPAVLPNTGLDNGLAPGDGVIEQGIFQVMVWTRPGAGLMGVNAIATSIAALFPKDYRIVSLLRVSRNPYITTIDDGGEKVGVMVTVPYSQ